MADKNLPIPIILSLDFLNKTSPNINMVDQTYGVKEPRGHKFHLYLLSPLEGRAV